MSTLSNLLPVAAQTGALSEEDLNLFRDSALVVVGHGSTLNAESSQPTYQHCDTLRSRGLFQQVQECFWKLEPNVCGVLRGIRSNHVFIVPLFISEGYFTEEVLPREFGFAAKGQKTFERVRTVGPQTLCYCGPVGTHDHMTEVLLSRARTTLSQFPSTGPERALPSNTTLFIAGHGTGNSENSRKAIERQVDLIRERNLYAAVHAVFMEEPPKIEECYTLAQTPNVVMVPFFISDGLHSYEDIPMMLGETESDVRHRLAHQLPTWNNPTFRRGKHVWYTPSIGTEPLIADVILERAAQMAREVRGR